MPRPEPTRGLALPVVLGLVMAMGVGLVSVWREVRLQTWGTRQDAVRQQTRQALQALVHDAVRDVQSGTAWLRATQTSGCQAGVCVELDTRSWTLAQWSQHAEQGASFGQASATSASPLAQGEVKDGRYWLERLPYDSSAGSRGGPQPQSPALLYRITAWLPATDSHAAMGVQVLWFQDDTDTRPATAAGQFVGWRKLSE